MKRGKPLMLFAFLLTFFCGALVGPVSGLPSGMPGNPAWIVVQQSPGSYIDEAELNAYDEARQEQDPRKRAVKLMEFAQKYPKSVLLDSSDRAQIRAIEDEYNAYAEALAEPGVDKRGEKLIDFLTRHPESELAKRVEYDYKAMLKELADSGRHEELKSLAEKWVRVRPKDTDAYAIAAESAMALKQYRKSGEYLEELYKLQPSPALARQIYSAFQRAEDRAKQAEWAQLLFKMPEFDADYMLRYDQVLRYSGENNLEKAADYCQLTLQSADLAEKKKAQPEEQIRKVRRACYHVIGSALMDKGDYPAAISAFKQAIRAERYAQGYYRIATILENQKNIDDALLYYAMAEIMGQEDSPKAKARLEVLYKALHNGTLIGIDKVYKKAKETLAPPQ